MLINNDTTWECLGRRVQAFNWLKERQNPRGQWFPNADAGRPSIGGGLKYLLRMRNAGVFILGQVTDVNRNWATPYQDITLYFNAKVQDASLVVNSAATGHTIKIGGAGQTTNYRSGSGTGQWVVRVPVQFKQSDVITYSYDGATGNTTVVDTATEITTVTDKAVSNDLSKRIRFVLKKSDNTVVVSETVKMLVTNFNGGTVGDFQSNWMRKEQWLTPATDANGQIDELYKSVFSDVAVGNTVYVLVIRPNASPIESFVWQDTVK